MKIILHWHDEVDEYEFATTDRISAVYRKVWVLSKKEILGTCYSISQIGTVHGYGPDEDVREEKGLCLKLNAKELMEADDAKTLMEVGTTQIYVY